MLCVQVNEEWQRKTEQLVQRAVGREREQQGVEVRAAVERAREEWRESLAQESRVSVEKALMSARQQWQTRYTGSLDHCGLSWSTAQVRGRDRGSETAGGQEE